MTARPLKRGRNNLYLRCRDRARKILRTNHPDVLANIVWLEDSITRGLMWAHYKAIRDHRPRAKDVWKLLDGCREPQGGTMVPFDYEALSAAITRALAVEQAESERLMKALKEYGEHHMSCLADAVVLGPAGVKAVIESGGDPDVMPQPCTCGFSDATRVVKK